MANPLRLGHTCAALIGIALVFGGCRLSCNAGTEKTLVWDRNGCTIKLPSDWREHPERETKGLFIAIDDTIGENVVVTLPFKVDPPVDHSTSRALETIAADLEKVAIAQSAKYQRISLEIVEVGGKPAMDWWYHVDVDGKTRLHGQRLIFRDDERIMASVSSPDLESTRLKGIIESFRPVEKSKPEN